MKEYAHILRAIANGDPIQWINGSCHWEPIKPSAALGKISTNGDALTYAPERFRVAPKTININGHKVPAPLRVAPRIGDLVYVPNVFTAQLCQWMTWDGAPSEFLDRGICHSSKEAAIAHARALLSFTEQKQ